MVNLCVIETLKGTGYMNVDQEVWIHLRETATEITKAARSKQRTTLDTIKLQSMLQATSISTIIP